MDITPWYCCLFDRVLEYPDWFGGVRRVRILGHFKAEIWIVALGIVDITPWYWCLFDRVLEYPDWLGGVRRVRFLGHFEAKIRITRLWYRGYHSIRLEVIRPYT